MQCPRCQHENPPGARFCEECASPLARTCSNCGTALSAVAKFCHTCAHPVVAAAGAQSRAPESYTPRHLAERIISSKASLEGERKQVTVLFADLKGSMELLADRDPEEARKILDPVLEHMMEAVHRYEGTVNQVMGDGIMALFGAPLAHEDHAVRACYAALRMQEAVGRYADELRRSHGLDVQIRVGLNSGEVVVRAIGSDLHMDYTAVGQTTHLAARMEQLARPGTTLMTAETLRLAEGYVAVRPLGAMPIKGLGGPLEVYEVTGTGPVRIRLQALGVRRLSRFVGRDTELEHLRQALEKARRGHGQAVAVVGEPGVGKSRLFYEFTHSHRAQGWLVLESGSVSYGKGTSYLPVIDLLKTYFQVEARDDSRNIRERVTGKLLTLDRAMEATVLAILALLDVPVDDAQWEMLDPPQRRQRTLDAVKRLLLRESQVQPLLVVFEDLHWVDAETQALLDSLVESLAGARVLLLVNYRPEYEHRWGGKTYYAQLRIDPLRTESAEELLDFLLGPDPSLRPLKLLLIERTEGNPFFLEESVRTLVETTVVAGEPGAYRLVEALPSIHVPASVQALLAARIDRLLPDEKRLLQLAAVIGKDVPLALLRAIAEVPEEALRSQLVRLQAAEFLYETRLFPDLEFTFKHALTQEVAYQSLLKDTREHCHDRIAHALEEQFTDVKETRPEVLAHHFTRAGLTTQAIGYWQRASAKAVQRSANVEAVSHLYAALELLGTLPDTPERDRQELDLQTTYGAALMVTSPRGYAAPEVRRAYGRARELCERLGDTPFRVLLGLRIAELVQGRFRAAFELAQRMLGLAQGAEDAALLLEAHRAMGETLCYLGRLTAARPHLEHTIHLDASLQHRSGLFLAGQSVGNSGVFGAVHLAFVLWLLGHPDQALRVGEGALALARQLSEAHSIAFALHGICYVAQNRRQARLVRESAEALIEIASEHGFPYWTVYGRIYRDWALVTEGLDPDGTERMRQDLAATMAAGSEIRLPPLLAHLAELYGKQGKARQGLEVIAEALAIAERNEERDSEAQIHQVRAELLLQPGVGDEQEAEISFRRALEVARRQNARSLELRAATSLARLWQRRGQREDARRLLADVYDWFTEGFDTADLVATKTLLEELKR